MKIPRKSDLISLQEVYKTDDKIAEALGGIPEYLVAYWRRKKGVPLWSEPKFSQQQIGELWERFGDDFRCGRELNLSKAAFYSWRRKYGILEKPAELKLEQLELRLPGDFVPETPKTVVKGDKPRTSTVKIIDRATESWPLFPSKVEGDAKIPADWTVQRDGTGENAPFIISPGPTLQRPASTSLEIPPANAHQPFWLSPMRGDLAWQLIEARAVLPGQLVIAPRPHLAGLGGVGILVLEPDIIKSLSGVGVPGCAPGSSPTLPRVARVEVTRHLPADADVEDIAMAMIDAPWRDKIHGRILELVGAPIERLTVDRKVKLCSSLVTLGAAAAIVTFDDTIRRHYGRILMGRFPQTHPDRTAVYDEEHFLEGRSIEPRVGILENADPSRADSSLQGTKESRGGWTILPADQAPKAGGVIIGPDALPYEIELCATLLKDRSGSPGFPPVTPPVIVCPGTQQVYDLAFRKGWAQAIIKAGGSIVDLALARRLGEEGLVGLVRSGSDRRATVTSLSSSPGRGNVSGTQTALSRLASAP